MELQIETYKSIKETLASLKQASGQSGEDISTNQITPDKAIDVDVHPVNLTKKPKKKESKSKKEEFKLDEEMVKNEDDQKIIAVKVPENIKNFGKSKFQTNGFGRKWPVLCQSERS